MRGGLLWRARALFVVVAAFGAVGAVSVASAGTPLRDTELACPPDQVPAAGFADVAGNVHAGDIDCAAWYALTTGTSATTYSPGQPITRAQFAAFLGRLFQQAGGVLPADPADAFPDDDASVHAGVIDALAELGLITGFGNGTFRPEAPASRAQAASLFASMLEALAVELGSGHPDAFDDDDGNIHEGTINALADLGLVGGRSEGVYDPLASVQRDEFASLLTRVLDLLIERGVGYEGGGDVMLSAASVRAGEQVSGVVTTHRIVDSLQVSGCTVPGSAVPVSVDGSFAVAIPVTAPVGPCTLSFELTTSASPPVTDVDAVEVVVLRRGSSGGPTATAPQVMTSPGATAYTEGGPATALDSALTVADPDDTMLESGVVRITTGFQTGDELVFVDQSGIVGVFNAGAGVLTLTGTAAVDDYQAALRSIEYRHTVDDPAPSKTVEFLVNDGTADSTSATKGIALTPVNDAPVITTTTTALSYTEGNGLVAVDPGLTVDDPDSASAVGATVQITGNFLAAEDQLSFVDLSGITGSYNTTIGVLTLSGSATMSDYQTALRTVRYANSSGDPSTSTRTISFQIDDGGTAANFSNIATRDVTVTGIAAVPVVTTSGGAVSYTEGGSAATVDGALTVSDTDSANLSSAQIRISIGFQSGDELAFVNQSGITGTYNSGTGVLSLAGGASVPAYQTALRSIKYGHTGDNPAAAKTVEFVVNDGTTDSDPATKAIALTAVNDAPVADDESFTGNDSAIGNTAMVVNDPSDGAPTVTHPKTTVTGDILEGDVDPDGPGPLTVTPEAKATNDGGSVTLEADGDFTFHPAAGTSCTDTSDFFDYTVTESGSSALTDTGRVTIALAGCVWYVNNDAVGNSGTAAAPFDTLAQAETASGANHTVFVFDGDGTATGYDAGGYQMDAGERLVGEHEGLTVDPDGGAALTADVLFPASPGAHPTLTALTANVVELDDDNEIRGVNIDPQATGVGINGGTGDSGGTIDDVNIVEGLAGAGTGAGVVLDGTTGSWSFTNFTVDNNAAGVILNGAGTVDFGGDTGVVTLDSDGAPALTASGTDMGTSYFDDIVVTNSASGGVVLTNLTGATTLGDGSGTDLNLTTTSGAVAALKADNVTGLTVNDGGTDTLSATGGPAVDVATAPGTILAFDQVQSTNSSTDGINLDGIGTGSFNASTTSFVSGAAGIAFDLNGGSGNVSYPGAVNDGSGQSIDVTNRTGGTVVIAGPINDGIDAGGGITLTGNSAGSTTLSNATKTLNTGALHAVIFNSSDGHSLEITGGGLNIDTTSGKGLEADTSGTLTVTGAGNTIDTASGRALYMNNTDIGNADVTFQSISSSGAVTGISLTNTANPAGRLFVTSTGSGACTSAVTCSGGAIQNSTGTGVVLSNVPGGAELMRLAVIDSADHGIHASGVSGGILLDRSYVFSNGNAATDNGLEFVDVTGVTAIRHSGVIGSGVANDGGFGARISNASGTLHLTVNDTDFKLASSGDGLRVGSSGTATIHSSITGNRFDDNAFDGFRIADGVAPTATSHHTFTGNTIDGKAGVATDGGIVVATDGSARVNVSNNIVTKVSGSAILLNPSGSGATAFEGTANNNVLGTNGTADSGSTAGDGIELQSEGNGTARVVLNNNSIYGWRGSGLGLRALGTTTGGETDVTAQNNTLKNHGSAVYAGIWLQAGSSQADALEMCADIGGLGSPNTLVAPVPMTMPLVADFVLDLAYPNAKLFAPGYTSPAENYFEMRNIGFTSFLQSGAQTPLNAPQASCDQPTPPTLPTAPPAVGP